MPRITEADRANTAQFLEALPGLVEPGDRIGFWCEDEGRKIVGVCDRVDARFVYVVLDSWVLWPLRFDEILPPF